MICNTWTENTGLLHASGMNREMEKRGNPWRFETREAAYKHENRVPYFKH